MTNRIDTLQKIIEQHGERTDPVDLYTVISVIADYEDIALREFIATRQYWDIINASQSNPARAHNAISRMVRADDAISRYEDEALDPDLP
jgi:hypothetical protein